MGSSCCALIDQSGKIILKLGGPISANILRVKDVTFSQPPLRTVYSDRNEMKSGLSFHSSSIHFGRFEQTLIVISYLDAAANSFSSNELSARYKDLAYIV